MRSLISSHACECARGAGVQVQITHVHSGIDSMQFDFGTIGHLLHCTREHRTGSKNAGARVSTAFFW